MIARGSVHPPTEPAAVAVGVGGEGLLELGPERAYNGLVARSALRQVGREPQR